MTEFDPAELTKERNLLDIYRQSRKITSSGFNQVASAIVLCLLLTYVLASSNVHVIARNVRELADLGFNFTVGILGFLLAGFTIFATVSKTKLLKTMAVTQHKESGLSYLKYSFFAFMKVFIVYLAFATLCLLIKIIGGPEGPVTLLITWMPSGVRTLKRVVASISLIVVGTWFFFLLMVLKSFIFNVYHIVMTAIRWEFENGQDNS